jgi:hypothetical protein
MKSRVSIPQIFLLLRVDNPPVSMQTGSLNPEKKNTPKSPTKPWFLGLLGRDYS